MASRPAQTVTHMLRVRHHTGTRVDARVAVRATCITPAVWYHVPRLHNTLYELPTVCGEGKDCSSTSSYIPLPHGFFHDAVEIFFLGT